MHERGRARQEEGITGWARSALALLGGLPAVSRVGLAVTEGGGRRLRFTSSDRHGDGDVVWCHIDAYDDVPLNTAIRSGRLVMGDLDELDARYADYVARQRGTTTVALAAVPLRAGGDTIGGYLLYFDESLRFRPGTVLELDRLGDDLGAALRRTQRGEPRPSLAAMDEPVPLGARVDALEVPPDPAAVALARRFVRRTLGSWGVDQDPLDAAVLCLSELVTNAVIHAPNGCVVRVLLDGRTLEVTVRDSGAVGDAAVGAPDDPFQVHGRGLQLVDALATRWGSRVDRAGTTVWFALDF